MVEPWLRGTHGELDAVRRQVVHALELTREDAERWCSLLTPEQMAARPFGLPSVGFQMRHIARSLDRLMTYAEGGSLDERQQQKLASEHEEGSPEAVWAEFGAGLAMAEWRVRACPPERFGEERFVGRDRVRTTLAGLLVHCAEHTQRHAGQMVTTAKVVAVAAMTVQ